MNAPAIQALTPQAFAPFGEVIDCGHSTPYPVNDGSALRYDRLARVAALGGGEVAISIFRAQPRPLPMRIVLLERHPLGSQAFVPMQRTACVIVVALDQGGVPGDIRAFYARPDQGVNYAAGVWHHPLIALGAGGDFLVVDRHGDGMNCDETALHEHQQFVLREEDLREWSSDPGRC
jgi:ureidoglycolate lyase